MNSPEARPAGWFVPLRPRHASCWLAGGITALPNGSAFDVHTLARPRRSAQAEGRMQQAQGYLGQLEAKQASMQQQAQNMFAELADLQASAEQVRRRGWSGGGVCEWVGGFMMQSAQAGWLPGLR